MQSESVSIIIPVRDKWELTAACLESIRRNTDGSGIEIIVMDNGSADTTAIELPRRFPDVRVIRDDKPLGFARANNVAARQARGELLLFLNNDTEVTPGWLPPLTGMLLSDPSIAAVGPRLLYPNGLVQQAGVVFNFCRSGYHFAARWRGDHPEANKTRDFKALTAACLLCRRSDFLDKGGFDEVFRSGCEDTDLCLKWHADGRRLVYVPSSTVIHRESQSAGRFDHAIYNMREFMKRWRDRVEPDDIEYYATSRLPQPGVATIPAVIRCTEPYGRLHNALFTVLAASECAMPVLLIADDPDNRHFERYRRLPGFITIADAGDTAAIGSWLEPWRADGACLGVLVLDRSVAVPVMWDRFVVHAARLAMPASFITFDGRDCGGIIRYAVTLPPESRQAPNLVARELRRRFGESVAISAGSVATGATFLPSRFLAATSGSRLAELAAGRMPLPLVRGFLPSCTVDSAGTAVPPLPPRPGSVVAVMRDSGPQQRQWLSRLGFACRSTGAELIVVDNAGGAFSDGDETLFADGVVAVVSLPRPVPASTARNAGAFASIGNTLAIVDQGTEVTAEECAAWFHPHNRRPTLELRGARLEGSRPARADCVVLQRSDFAALGGFDEQFRDRFAEYDLCLRFAQLHRSADGIRVSAASAGAADPAADPQGDARFAAKWRGL